MLSGDHIELIIAIVEHGSFSAAARALRKAPSAVSMAIGNLEAEIGITLFDRSKREPVPTAELNALLPDARLIAGRLNALRTHLGDLAEGVEAKLTIGVGADMHRQPILDAVQVVADTYPHLRIDIMIEPQDTVIDALHAGRTDICVAFGGLDLRADEQVRHLWTETLLAVVSPEHPLAAIAPSSLSIERLFEFRQIVIAGAHDHPSDSRPIVSGQLWHVNSLEAAVDAVGRGLGWANLPEHAVARSGGKVHPLTFSNISNGLALPVYLRALKRISPGQAAKVFMRAIADRRQD